jgi:hypothetical protein
MNSHWVPGGLHVVTKQRSSTTDCVIDSIRALVAGPFGPVAGSTHGGEFDALGRDSVSVSRARHGRSDRPGDRGGRCPESDRRVHDEICLERGQQLASEVARPGSTSPRLDFCIPIDRRCASTPELGAQAVPPRTVRSRPKRALPGMQDTRGQFHSRAGQIAPRRGAAHAYA